MMVDQRDRELLTIIARQPVKLRGSGSRAAT